MESGKINEKNMSFNIDDNKKLNINGHEINPSLLGQVGDGQEISLIKTKIDKLISKSESKTEIEEKKTSKKIDTSLINGEIENLKDVNREYTNIGKKSKSKNRESRSKHKNKEFPENENIKINMKIEKDRISKSIVVDDDKVESPLKNDDKVESPLKNDDKVESPLKNDDKVESPLKNDDKVETPLKNDDKVETPLKNIHIEKINPTPLLFPSIKKSFMHEEQKDKRSEKINPSISSSIKKLREERKKLKKIPINENTSSNINIKINKKHTSNEESSLNKDILRGTKDELARTIVDPRKIRPKFETMTEAKEKKYRENINLRLQVLKIWYPKLKFEIPPEDTPAKQQWKLYKTVHKNMSIAKYGTSYKNYIVLGFLAIEIFFSRVFDIDMEGMTKYQLKFISIYQEYIGEISFKKYLSIVDEWSPFTKLSLLLSINTAVFVLTKWLSPNSSDMVGSINKVVVDMLTDKGMIDDDNGIMGLLANLTGFGKSK